eukprot:GAHX01004322.1.p1 GENE.GAHX01004322.1~~GAHX01004322.1.p1  ORF type:complete len:76 (-),score=3.04 GAHX01004322.1:126-353(-)
MSYCIQLFCNFLIVFKAVFGYIVAMHFFLEFFSFYLKGIISLTKQGHTINGNDYCFIFNFTLNYTHYKSFNIFTP